MTKSEIKNIKLLHQKKYRNDQKLFIAEGSKVVNELLKSNFKLKNLFATKEFSSSDSTLKVKEISRKELEQISSLTTPNEVLGVFEMRNFRKYENFSDELVLALDDIRDPGNFGTIIRVADWFGIKNILCSENCVDIYNPKVVQGSMGSIARVDIHYMNLESFFNSKTLKAEMYAAVMNGKNIYSEKLPGKGIILIGNESRGVSENLLRFSAHKISIPNFGEAESLNAAIATAIICSEFRRS